LAPAGNVTLEGGAYDDGIFTLFQKETRLWTGFDATSGNQLWASTVPEVSNYVYGVSPANSHNHHPHSLHIALIMLILRKRPQTSLSSRKTIFLLSLSVV
jgi:hypothetical protein